MRIITLVVHFFKDSFEYCSGLYVVKLFRLIWLAGVILLRNCQWSIDLLHAWARFSPKGPVREAAGALLTEAFPVRPLGEAEDQCALVYLLLTQR